MTALLSSILKGSATPATVPQGGTGVITLTGLVKGNGTSAMSAAEAGIDYAPGTNTLATGLLKSTTATGALTTAVSGTDYAPGTSTLATGLLKSTTATGALTTATANSDYVHPTGNDSQVTRQMWVDCGYTFLDKGNSGTSTQTLDYTAGSHQKITTTGNHTIATSNWPPTGNRGEIVLQLVNGAAYTITWPTVNWVKSDGSTTTTFASNGVTLQSSGTDFVVLWTIDAGTTIYGKIMR